MDPNDDQFSTQATTVASVVAASTPTPTQDDCTRRASPTASPTVHLSSNTEDGSSQEMFRSAPVSTSCSAEQKRSSPSESDRWASLSLFRGDSSGEMAGDVASAPFVKSTEVVESLSHAVSEQENKEIGPSPSLLQDEKLSPVLTEPCLVVTEPHSDTDHLVVTAELSPTTFESSSSAPSWTPNHRATCTHTGSAPVMDSGTELTVMQSNEVQVDGAVHEELIIHLQERKPQASSGQLFIVPSAVLHVEHEKDGDLQERKIQGPQAGSDQPLIAPSAVMQVEHGTERIKDSDLQLGKLQEPRAGSNQPLIVPSVVMQVEHRAKTEDPIINADVQERILQESQIDSIPMLNGSVQPLIMPSDVKQVEHGTEAEEASNIVDAQIQHGRDFQETQSSSAPPMDGSGELSVMHGDEVREDGRREAEELSNGVDHMQMEQGSQVRPPPDVEPQACHKRERELDGVQANSPPVMDELTAACSDMQMELETECHKPSDLTPQSNSKHDLPIAATSRSSSSASEAPVIGDPPPCSVAVETEDGSVSVLPVKLPVVSLGMQLICQMESSQSEDSSSSSSEDSSDKKPIQTKVLAVREEEEEEEEFGVKGSRGYPMVKGEIDYRDLPLSEGCHYSFPPEGKLLPVGRVSHMLEQLVVVEAWEGSPTIDEGTVLWSAEKTSLATVFETFGPVKSPFYSVRVSSVDHAHELGLSVGLEVFAVAGNGEHTKFVFPQELMREKGSDASWKNDTEVPSEMRDFSDDECEKASKHKKTGGKRERGKERKGTTSFPPSTRPQQAASAQRPSRQHRHEPFLPRPPPPMHPSHTPFPTHPLPPRVDQCTFHPSLPPHPPFQRPPQPRVYQHQHVDFGVPSFFPPPPHPPPPHLPPPHFYSPQNHPQWSRYPPHRPF